MGKDPRPTRVDRLIASPKLNYLSFGVANSDRIIAPLLSTKGFSLKRDFIKVWKIINAKYALIYDVVLI